MEVLIVARGLEEGRLPKVGAEVVAASKHEAEELGLWAILGTVPWWACMTVTCTSLTLSLQH